jgi:hypothetical protein
MAMLLMSFCILQAQQSFTVSGGNAQSDTGNISYAVGQSFGQTYVTETGSLSEGVLQPFEISDITDVESVNVLVNLSVYPNPTSDCIILDISDELTTDMLYQVFTIDGKTVSQNSIRDNRTTIDLTSAQTGVYLLKVFDNNRVIRVFKIIKNQ